MLSCSLGFFESVWENIGNKSHLVKKSKEKKRKEKKKNTQKEKKEKEKEKWMEEKPRDNLQHPKTWRKRGRFTSPDFPWFFRWEPPRPPPPPPPPPTPAEENFSFVSCCLGYLSSATHLTFLTFAAIMIPLIINHNDADCCKRLLASFPNGHRWLAASPFHSFRVCLCFLLLVTLTGGSGRGGGVPKHGFNKKKIIITRWNKRERSIGKNPDADAKAAAIRRWAVIDALKEQSATSGGMLHSATVSCRYQYPATHHPPIHPSIHPSMEEERKNQRRFLPWELIRFVLVGVNISVGFFFSLSLSLSLSCIFFYF